MLKANVRTETFLEDLNAMMSANLLAEKRVHDLYSKYGKSVMDQVQKYVLDYSERLLRAEIGTWPQGTFVGEDYFEHDMHGARNLKVRAAVTIDPSKGELTIDFTGSSPQAKGFVNSPIANTYSGIFLAIAYSLPENWSANDGFYRAIKVIAPEGSIVNPRPPAPTGSCTTFPAISVINSVTEALSKAIPKKAGQFQPHFLLPLQLQGIDPRTGKWYLNGNRDCFYGGSGAIYGIDGWGGSCPYTAMVYCTPTEQLERSYPIVTLENEFVQDTGGSGRWRGMPGNRIRRRVYGHDATVTAMVLGTHFLVRGSCGGTDGGPNEVVLREGATDEKRIETWAVDEPIRDGQIYAFQTGGGGGYGDPLQRDPELVLEDVIDGYISTNKALEDYKVTIDPKTFVLDRAATAAAREREIERRSHVS
jgi:N-methylhydantoinase B